MPFLNNAWYAAGWSETLGDAPIRIKVVGQPLAIFRGSDGRPTALGDVCPHRFASLGLGKVIGDTVQCPYHGLRFDRTGACVHNPHADGIIPPGAQVKSYPVVERHHAI